MLKTIYPSECMLNTKNAPTPEFSTAPSAYLRIIAIVACAYALMFGALTSCSSTEFKVEEVTGSEEVLAGSRAFLAWRFSAADSVVIDALDKSFPAAGMVYTFPDSTTDYLITAHLDDDTLKAGWTVRVVHPQPILDTIRPVDEDPRGPSDAAAFRERYYSTLRSEYLRGYASADQTSSQNATGLKILRVVDSENDAAPAELHAIVLDQYGNFMADQADAAGTWKVNLDCREASFAYEVEPIIEQRSDIAASQLSIAVCADYAAYMDRYLPQTDQAYHHLFCSLAPDDEVSFIPFDHRTDIQFMGVNSYAARDRFTPGSYENHGGLTALYRAAYEGLSALEQSDRPLKALILVSGGPENSSIQYTINDVAQAAKESGVAIYSIALGSEVDTYALRYLAQYTGGRFYSLAEPPATDLKRIMQEIALAYQTYYVARLDAYAFDFSALTSCDQGYTATLSYHPATGDKVKGSAVCKTPDEPYSPFHQILSTYAHGSARLDPAFTGQYRELAQLLIDNSDKVIEVTGHASIEGSERANQLLSLQRAQQAQDYLVGLGVPRRQIRIHAAGNEKPIYMMQAEEWQAQRNRRVEIRWLDPALRPYEILAEIAYTEEEARTLTDEWVARGVRAYYDVFLYRKTPAFRVILWGFATREEADLARSELQRRYGVRLAVQ